MTSEALVQSATNTIWKMARHTVTLCCSRYKPCNKERICRACLANQIRSYYEHADEIEATEPTHTESE